MKQAVLSSRRIESIAPFRSSPEVRDATHAVVTGSLPSWLRGELVRTCPAVFHGARWQAGHWFDGLCMTYAFRVGSVGASQRTETSALSVIDARSMDLLASAEVESWVPLGFHGSFVPAGDEP